MTLEARLWAVLPAAGVGKRMGSTIPKQYLELAGRTVIEHSLKLFVDHDRISGVVVALGSEDGYWDSTAYAVHPKVRRAAGGAERCHSVLNALLALEGCADDRDWVLVHDAARPCLRIEDLERLIERLLEDSVGGLLGIPVRDTMKRAKEDQRIDATLDRSALWHAFTPQMFRLGLLRTALQDALSANDLVTDDASAIERLGQAPRLIEGHADNIKITRAEDLPLARFYLHQQGRID
ncbi:2-C-methyl-D-erythritol 4-phosphate cytidylyltransferase [Thiorhodococcus mannitoliphagus]|uniref:2-C-methyl-D-erythritol 4-phosphate cytidylyltransferase n=1 Tax=Thiorhodococcus mannitoliphagus TaxID=329406 RepID=A0A6P1DQA1_9GAMM|nr:2-C-methyl-D-erythritol 4-phosphate cytidylyltransferase [Thiorhodococcus mannitoliphagus]NEX20198.1 2-C-methyl-D-erythritol 4-phosphate cytidylyltransferase [Thiorhodococcus mannitoliphagus]